MAGSDFVSPEWLSRNGATYKWTAQHHRAHEKALSDARVNTRVLDKLRPPGDPPQKRRASLRFGVIICVIYFPSMFILSRYAPISHLSDQTLWFIGGILFGIALTFVALVIWSARRGYRIRNSWRYPQVVTTGVDAELLWLNKNNTTYHFLSKKAFCAVVRTKDYITAYATPDLLHAFPRLELEKTMQGRMVLEWFDANWPTSENISVQLD